MWEEKDNDGSGGIRTCRKQATAGDMLNASFVWVEKPAFLTSDSHMITSASRNSMRRCCYFRWRMRARTTAQVERNVPFSLSKITYKTYLGLALLGFEDSRPRIFNLSRVYLRPINYQARLNLVCLLSMLPIMLSMTAIAFQRVEFQTGHSPVQDLRMPTSCSRKARLYQHRSIPQEIPR